MGGLKVVAFAIALFVLPAWVHGASPELEPFLRKPVFESVTISPSGEYLAVRIALDDRTILGTMRRSDGAWLARLDPGERGFIDGAFWVSDDRLFASWSVRARSIAEPVSVGMLYGMDVDGKNRKEFYGRVIDPLVRVPDRVLVLECARVVQRRCLTKLRETSATGRGKTVDIADGPVPGATFLTDRLGSPRFSWAVGEDDMQRVFLLRSGEWVKINDESESGVRVDPLGVNFDMTHGYLWSERPQGPDVIETIELATGAREVVSSDPDMNPRGLVWSFEGEDLIGVRYGEGAPVIRYLDPDHPHASLIREVEDEFPGEVVRITSRTRDGRHVILNVASDRDPGRYYLLDVEDGRMTSLMLRREWITPASMSPAEPISLMARDGIELRGYLTRPRGGHVAPLVVLVHGGPFGIADEWEFDTETQMLAKHGYAVLRINFRGSGGRGRDFVESGYREWGRKMQDDIADATHWALDQPGIDRGRVCIWGASYGGYAAMMGAIREPDLYRCVIAMAAPYDLPTMYKWGDIPRTESGERLLELRMGRDMDDLRENSPAQHAGRIKAGLLLAHGGLDERVSPEHLRAMRRALDRAGKPYEIYLARGETHGFYDGASQREYYGKVFEFLDRYLGGGADRAR